MANLLGDMWTGGEPNWPSALAFPDVKLHLYGKHEARPGRKMGHAGAIISGSSGTAQAKMEALSAAGVAVAQNPTECGEKVVEIVRGLG